MSVGIVYSMTSVIPIGYVGENETREIAIDIRPLIRAWPDLAPVLLAKRPRETALYPCVTRVENGVLYWWVTLSDTAIPGKGECVIHMIDGEGRVGKSRTMTTMIERSASGEEAQEPPEAIRPWIDDVLASIESVKAGYVEVDQGEENAGLVLVVGEDGRVTLKKGGAGGDGVGVESVEQTQESVESGGENVWTLRLTDSTTSRLIVRNGARGAQGERGATGEQGERGPTGEAGPQGPAGEPGKPGEPGPAGEPGKDGIDGVSPITSFERIDGGYRLTIKDAAGTHSVEIMDGVGVQGPAGPQGPEGPAGERGEQGERGAPFAIAKIYPSQDAMNAGYATDGVAAGGFVLIETGDVNDEENARLYVKGESRYEYVTDLSGAQGIQGPEGKQGPQGPAGNPGAAGADGKDGTSVTIKSVSESSVDGGSNVIAFNDGNSVTVKNGKTGAQGPAGPAGSDATVTATNIQAALGYKPASEASVSQLSENKVDNSGWGANKNLGTDENGNVIEKDDIFSKDISAWSPVEYMNGVAWTEKGYYWQANGTHTSTQYTTDYQSTQELIRIEPNCEYTLSNFRGVYWLYDSSGKNGVASDGVNDPNVSVSFTTNANQYYVGLSFKPDGAYTTDRVSFVRNTISQTEYDALPTRADSLKSLYGKKAVCFGDSLFGMYRGDDSAPAFVAAETGATVYNVGFGGCRMSVHPSTGYAAFSMWALAKAISENNWTTQDAQASSGSDYFPDQLALLKSIDFSKVDIAVIHYGTNDFGAGNAIALDNASDPDDYNTLCGALRYSLDKLLGKYPKLRIYVSLPVYRYWVDGSTTTYAETYVGKSGKTLPEFVEALRSTAAEYNLPVIDGYYGLGINKANAAAFLSDGTHHNLAGRERFGRYIGANLIAQQTSGKSGVDMTAVQALIDNSIGAAIGGAY